jgi:hypothetical protein
MRLRLEKLLTALGRRLALAALLAAVSCGVALGAATLPDEDARQAASALGAASILCRAPAQPGQTPPPAHRRGASDAACPLPSAFQHMAALTPSAPAIPVPRLVAVLRATAARPRAPPSVSRQAAWPRGPPPLV